MTFKQYHIETEQKRATTKRIMSVGNLKEIQGPDGLIFKVFKPFPLLTV